MHLPLKNFPLFTYNELRYHVEAIFYLTLHTVEKSSWNYLPYLESSSGVHVKWYSASVRIPSHRTTKANAKANFSQIFAAFLLLLFKRDNYTTNHSHDKIGPGLAVSTNVSDWVVCEDRILLVRATCGFWYVVLEYGGQLCPYMCKAYSWATKVKFFTS